jgi:hypothetical protein
VLTSRTTVRDSGLFYASADELHHKELISRIELRNTGKLRGDSPAASWIDQELDFDRADPRFPRSSRRFFAPSAAIRKMLGLTRSDVTKLEWTHEDVVIARTEIWCDTENTPRSDFVYGSRLLMRASSVQEILLKTRKRLIAHVSLHRGTGYRDQSSRERNVFEQHVDIGDLIRRTEKSAVHKKR